MGEAENFVNPQKCKSRTFIRKLDWLNKRENSLAICGKVKLFVANPYKFSVMKPKNLKVELTYKNSTDWRKKLFPKKEMSKVVGNVLINWNVRVGLSLENSTGLNHKVNFVDCKKFWNKRWI